MTMSSYKETGVASPDLVKLAIKVLSNSNRYALMRLMLNTKRDLCVNELAQAIGISQSATSHQLAHLEACGVVRSIPMGRTRCYVPTNSPLTKKVATVINSLT